MPYNGKCKSLEELIYQNKIEKGDIYNLSACQESIVHNRRLFCLVRAITRNSD